MHTQAILPERNQIINGRYILLEEIGRGGMGTVYKAIDRLTGEVVALKQVVIVDDGRDEAYRQSLAHEFQTLAGLRHPHIISVLDYGFDGEKQPFFTMTYMPKSQSILTASQDVPFDQKIELVEQLLQGLTYLHRRGILHRDIKPGNILVVDGSVRLLDFGLSQHMDEAGHMGGSAVYMSPELIDGSTATVSSDLYAVGVLLYTLITGHHPFGQFDAGFYRRLFFTEPDMSEVDRRVAPLLIQLLAKSPDKRPETAVVTLTLLAEALNKPLPKESDAIRDSYLQAAKFVGRKTELTRLTIALEKTGRGEGSGWLIGGESGVGKSRLLSELQTEALVAGFLVLNGQSKLERDGSPYPLWRDLLRHAVVAAGEIDELTASVLLPLVPDIGHLLNRSVEAAPELSDKAYQLRLFTTINALIQQIDRPVLLILEDLHWGRESLLLIRQLTQQINHKRLMLIGSYRNDERPDLPNTFPGLDVIELKRLSAEMISELSVAMLGDVGKRPEVISLLQRETEGNAFFAVEVVRALAGEVDRLSAVGDIDLPERLLPNGIRDVIHQRLERLSDAAKSLLIMAAIAGRELDLRLMRALADDIDVEGWWLSECADAAVLEVQQGEWRFNHDKLREGLLAELSDTEIAECHQQIATTLEALHGDEPAEAARMAAHWHHAGNVEKGITLSLRAGHHAAAQFAYEDAITYFSQAIRHLPPSQLERRYDVLLAREGARAHSTADRNHQLEDLDELSKIADQLEDHAKRVKIAVRRADFYLHTSKFEDAMETAQLAIEHQSQEKDEALILEAHLIWGNAALRLQRYEIAIDQIQYAIKRYRELANLPELSKALKSLGNTYLDMGKQEDASQHYHESLSIAQKVGDKRVESQLYNNLGIISIYQTNYDAAISYLKSALAHFEETGDLFVSAIVLENYGSCFYQIGDYVRAFDLLQQAIEINRRVSGHWGENQELIWLSLIVEKGQNYADAIEIIKESIDYAESLGLKNYVGERLAILGFVFAHQRRFEEARALLNGATTMLGDTPQIEIVIRIRFCQGRMAHQEERWVQASAHYKEMLSLLQDEELALDIAYLRVAANSNLAAIALSRGDIAEALNYAEPAIAHLLTTSLPDGENDMRTAAQCYAILEAAGDSRANSVLERAYTVLQERARLIKDEDARRFALEGVPDHQHIVQLYKRLNVGHGGA